MSRTQHSPGFNSFHCLRWRIKFSLERFSDSVSHLFACPAVGKFSRASSAGGRRHLELNFVNQIVSVAEDCLSPERTFHGCLLMCCCGCFRCCFRGSNSVALQLACPAVGKFSRASSAGGRRHLQLNFVNQIVSVAEDCLSPERTFHGCPLMHFRGCFRRANRITRRRAA